VRPGFNARVANGIIRFQRSIEEQKLKTAINIGIIGDFDLAKISHPATNDAIQQAAEYLGLRTSINWLPTPAFLTAKSQPDPAQFDGLWASAGSPYQSMEGMIKAIQIARETHKPFIST
jgi:CTP synthase (UTP-ammonia lyase)